MVATRIDWVREHCQLLRAISAEFGRTRPFDGLTIGTGIHLEAKTVALLLTLRDGGARLISTGVRPGGLGGSCEKVSMRSWRKGA